MPFSARGMVEIGLCPLKHLVYSVFTLSNILFTRSLFMLLCLQVGARATDSIRSLKESTGWGVFGIQRRGTRELQVLQLESVPAGDIFWKFQDLPTLYMPRMAGWLHMHGPRAVRRLSEIHIRSTYIEKSWIEIEQVSMVINLLTWCRCFRPFSWWWLW